MKNLSSIVAALATGLLLALPAAAIDNNSCCSGGCSGVCSAYNGGNCPEGTTAIYCATDGQTDYCCPRDVRDCCAQCVPKTSGECPADQAAMSCADVNKACEKAATGVTADAPPYAKCNADTNYAPGTKWAACCSAADTTKCDTCCSIDEAHKGSCPAPKVYQKSCDVGAAGTAAAIKTIAVPNPLGTPNVQSVLGKFAGVLVGISGSLALLVFVWAGITLITAQGDAAKIRRARGMMTWTAVGLAVIFLAEPAVRLILSALLKGEVS